MSEENVFDQMAEEGQNMEEQVVEKKPMETVSSDEVDYEKLSDVAVGQQKKYERPNLDGKEDKILKAQLFMPSSEDDVITALSNSDVKYKKCKFILTYESKNEDEMNNREYLSGAICFVQKDGSLSEPKLFNPDGENQICDLWRKVAKFKGVEPEELSPKQFLATLNSGLKVKLVDTEVKYMKERYHKNLIGEILG